MVNYFVQIYSQGSWENFNYLEDGYGYGYGRASELFNYLVAVFPTSQLRVIKQTLETHTAVICSNMESTIDVTNIRDKDAKQISRSPDGFYIQEKYRGVWEDWNYVSFMSLSDAKTTLQRLTDKFCSDLFRIVSRTVVVYDKVIEE